MPTLAVLVIRIPIRVSGWISIPASASTIKHGQSFVGGSSQVSGMQQTAYQIRSSELAEQTSEIITKKKEQANYAFKA